MALPADSETSPTLGRFIPPGAPEAGGIADLVLIYQGGSQRPAWTPEEFRPYIAWTDPETSRTEWLFDGFLFLEIFDRAGWEFAKGYGKPAARREHWEIYLDSLFAPGRALHGLDTAVEEAWRRLGPPPRPRRVVIMLPEPILDQTDWGEAGDGRALDFHNPEDRVAACRWYLDEALARWSRAGFRHIELAGFYWVAEHTKGRGENILPQVGGAVRERHRLFYWIPYWNAPGARDWRTLGFDMAYQQPNHFFTPTLPDSRLDDTARFARRFGMGLEMEWDARAMNKKETFAPRLAAYLDAFERHGAWREAAVAHYEGGGAFAKLSRVEDDPALRALFTRYCRFLAARQLAGATAPAPAEQAPAARP